MASTPSLRPLGSMDDFLRPTEVIDWREPSVLRQAAELAEGGREPVDLARRTFEWVRDEVRHSFDHRDTTVTCVASEVLAHRTGFCYAKSHLLAALLRANAIPAGLCYQRLSFDDNGPPYSLHGFNAIYLPDHGWYRVDARGNRPGVDARFEPPVERLAFAPRLVGEADLPEIWPDADPVVVRHLRRNRTCAALVGDLPDRELL